MLLPDSQVITGIRTGHGGLGIKMAEPFRKLALHSN